MSAGRDVPLPSHGNALIRALGPVYRKQAGAAVALCGEAGIGKTHALASVLDAAPCRHATLHATAALGTAIPAQRPRTLSLLTDTILDQTARGDPVEPDAVARAFADLMRSLAPFVLAFEDAHEADEPRTRFLEELGRLARLGRGIAVVVTTRHEPPEHFRAFRIEPLGLEEAHALLEAEIGARVPDAAVDWIHERAAGNPLFTLEYFRHLARQGHAWSDGRSWHWRTPAVDSMPTTVEALLEEPIRRARATPGLVDVLEARAALDRDVDADVLMRVAGVAPSDLRAAERALERLGVLRDGDFSHPLFREVSRATTPPQRRADLARRAIRTAADDPVRAARYVPDAGLPAEDALRILAAAAEGVRRRDEVQAGRWIAAAVPFAPPERGARLAVEAARILQPVDQGEARRLLGVALDALPNDPDALLQLAELEAGDGQQDAVDALLARLPRDPRIDEDWAERHAKLRFAMGDYQAVADAWNALPDRDAPSPDMAYRAGFALVVLDRLTDADAIARAALERPGLAEIDRARLLTVRGLAAAYAGEPERAKPFLEDAVRMARASGHKAYLASTLHNRATFYEEMNDVPGMLADAREALRLYAETRSTRFYASTLTKLARILHETGRYEEAESRYLESRTILQQARPSAFAVTCEAHLSSLYLDWRSPHARALAHKHAAAAVSLAERIHDHDKMPQALTSLSVVETRLGRPERGMALLDELARLQPDRERTTYQVVEARARALEALGDRAGAEERYDRAMAMAFASDWHVYAHKVGLELDRLRGDVPSAAARAAWFEAHGLLNGARIARAYFPGLAAAGGEAATRRTAASGAAADAAIARSAPLRAAGAADGATPPVRLEVLGPMRVVRDGHEVPLRGRLRRELLALLLEQRLAGAEGLSVPDLIDALYPDRDEASAAASLKQLAFQTRKALGASALVATRTGYALGRVGSDAEDFLESLDARLWRGPYREDLDEGNAAVASALTHGLRSAAWALVERDPEEAKRVGLLMLRADPFDPRNLHLALSALHAAGRSDEAHAVYASARARFVELGENLPASWREWLHAQHPTAAAEGIAPAVTAANV